MKEVDIRKVYICQTGKQLLEDPEIETYSVLGKSYNYEVYHTLDYEKDTQQYGLFKKVFHGLGSAYKHILTDTVYLEADSTTGGQYVVIPESVELLTQKERDLCVHLISKYKSYKMDLDVIKSVEDRINENAKFLNDEENTIDDFDDFADDEDNMEL